MAWVDKKYKLDKQENFEEYMKAIGECWDEIFYRFFISGNFQLKMSRRSAMTYWEVKEEATRRHCGNRPKFVLLFGNAKIVSQCTPKNVFAALKPVFFSIRR